MTNYLPNTYPMLDFKYLPSRVGRTTRYLHERGRCEMTVGAEVGQVGLVRRCATATAASASAFIDVTKSRHVKYAESNLPNGSVGIKHESRYVAERERWFRYPSGFPRLAIVLPTSAIMCVTSRHLCQHANCRHVL